MTVEIMCKSYCCCVIKSEFFTLRFQPFPAQHPTRSISRDQHQRATRREYQASESLWTRCACNGLLPATRAEQKEFSLPPVLGIVDQKGPSFPHAAHELQTYFATPP